MKWPICSVQHLHVCSMSFNLKIILILIRCVYIRLPLNEGDRLSKAHGGHCFGALLPPKIQYECPLVHLFLIYHSLK